MSSVSSFKNNFKLLGKFLSLSSIFALRIRLRPRAANKVLSSAPSLSAAVLITFVSLPRRSKSPYRPRLHLPPLPSATNSFSDPRAFSINLPLHTFGRLARLCLCCLLAPLAQGLRRRCLARGGCGRCMHVEGGGGTCPVSKLKLRRQARRKVLRTHATQEMSKVFGHAHQSK